MTVGTTAAAGDLNQRVSIRRRAVSKDVGGRETVTWPAIAEMWACKRDVSGREQLAAGQVAAEHVSRFLIRWRADVRTTDRVDCGGQLYEVQHVAELGRREFLQVTAKQVLRP